MNKTPWPPTRLRDLDPETIEFLARLNDDERRRLIEVSHLSIKETARLRQFLSLPDEKWDAGFRIVTRSVVFNRLIRSVPKLILGLAALIIAINQIWQHVSPYFLRSVGK